jgi:hypothetical protein
MDQWRACEAKFVGTVSPWIGFVKNALGNEIVRA